MNNNTKKDRHSQGKTFSDWLELLQQESWQLELIISSILLLILDSSEDSIKELIQSLHADMLGLFVGLFMMILFFIKTNLVIHIVFRGLWIGCIGLRYISNDIDFDNLAYANRFKSFLKKRVTSFDTYIERLERISSIIFSYSFLMVFHFISFCIFIIFCLGSLYVIARYDIFPKFLIIIFALILSLAGILNFIDFLTLGSLKRNKWIALIYYPFYRIYNIISLSFLYRPLHYNFIDNKLGRRYMLFMLPYMLFLLIFQEGVSVGSYNYLPLVSSNANWILKSNYDNLQDDSPSNNPSIDKLNYTESSMQLFIPYHDTEDTEKCLKALCPEFVPAERSQYDLNFILDMKSGFKHAQFDKQPKKIRDSIIQSRKLKADESLRCISKLYAVSIDSITYPNISYAFYENSAGVKGLITYLDISQLSNGKHHLNIETKTDLEDGEFISTNEQIPFFKNGIEVNPTD